MPWPFRIPPGLGLRLSSGALKPLRKGMNLLRFNRINSYRAGRGAVLQWRRPFPWVAVSRLIIGLKSGTGEPHSRTLSRRLGPFRIPPGLGLRLSSGALKPLRKGMNLLRFNRINSYRAGRGPYLQWRRPFPWVAVSRLIIGLKSGTGEPHSRTLSRRLGPFRIPPGPGLRLSAGAWKPVLNGMDFLGLDRINSFRAGRGPKCNEGSLSRERRRLV